ncbi:MAG: hypothetical protein Q9195_002027 [Heterodermia aff. obscurata]
MAAPEVSSTRLYLGNLPRDVTKEDIQAHFSKDGTGTITEVKLMNGFGFIEYDDPLDARDMVPAFHGSDLNGSRLTVQFARGTRQRDAFAAPDRTHPRPRRTAHRMQITGLPGETSWQDLKDFARRSGLDVVYSEVGRDRDGKGFVEFETAADMKVAVEKLDSSEFKGSNVRCLADKTSRTLDVTVVLAHRRAVEDIHLQMGVTTDVATDLLVGTAPAAMMVIVAALLLAKNTIAIVIVATALLPAAAPVALLLASLIRLLAGDTPTTAMGHLAAATTTITLRTGTNVHGLVRHHEAMGVVTMIVRATGDRLFRACQSGA